jgi:hypothetical protein
MVEMKIEPQRREERKECKSLFFPCRSSFRQGKNKSFLGALGVLAVQTTGGLQ